ncbi:MAG TPA: ArdC-like ssDNA-binding domain-containing protein [Candidatus Angelobacter sp.]|jgi:antirestriction protein ArdC|nr:ArdC-like ssDNA-binding domain-containing protein [Candidatus Angelobacter sp.]
MTRRRRSTTRPVEGESARDRLLAQLHDGVAALTSSERWAAWLRVQSRLHRYSFQNALLIAMQCPDATRVAGYRAWQALGRQVRAGEHGIAIFAPIARRVQVDPDDEDAPQSVRVVQAFRIAYVFDISQTDGPALPEIATRLDGPDPGNAVAQLDAAATALGFRVDVVELTPGVDGSCSHRDGVIRIDTNLAPAHRVVTEAHELAHAVLHPDGYAGTPRAQAELEAESVAYIVCHHLGVDSSAASFGYVAHWGGGEDATAAITASATAIRRGAATILIALGVDQQAAIAA